MNRMSSTKERLMRAALLERAKQRHRAPGATPTTAPPITPVDRDRPLAASWSQERLWFLDRLDPAAGRAYHIAAGLRLRGELDRLALRRSLDRVVARHDSLRTTFHAGDHDRPVQRVAPADQGFRLTEHDLRGLAADEQHRRLEELVAREARAPFDLAAGPLIRGRLVQLSGDDHVLLITQHHIVSDGWSIGVLVKEFSALYAAFREGRGDPLPAPQLQYADYAAWQRAWLDDVALESQVSFWREHLRDAPAVLELPSDRPRPPVQSHRGAAVALALDPALTAALRAFSRARGATPFMTLLAAWSALLSRLGGQPDVVVGTPVANRTRPEVESMIGFFVNTLALRVSTDGDPTVAELMERVRSRTLDAYAHQDLSFDRVVEAIRPQRSLGHAPVFQTVLALNNTPPLALQLPRLELAAFDVPQTTTQHDLVLSLTEAEHAIRGQIGYATDLFDHASIERLARQFTLLLRGMLADDTQRVSRLPLLDDEDRHRVLVSFNATDRALPPDAVIHRLFERQVRHQPHAIAVVAGERSLSYDALNRRANQLARHLRRLGVQPEDRVAICAERGAEMIAGMLGVLKAGACYVPLDPAQPAARLAHMLRDSAPTALLIQRGPGDALDGHGVPVIVLDAPASQSPFGGEADDDLAGEARAPSARDLAYVMYTSGSTGLPKGVMVEHRSVVRLVVDCDYAPIDATDTVAHCANPAFDAATWEVWSALLNGGKVVALPDAVVLDPEAFGRALTEAGVTALWLTVGLFNAYVDAVGPAFGKLRVLLVGGDALDPARIADLLERGHAPGHLINGYGPTEGTTFTTTHAIGPVVSRTRSIPIGRPISNTRVYILDGHGQPVPVGVAGEIYIGGAGVARGYLNLPELTTERFVPDPFVREPDARLYRSGDRGRWRPDGTIEFLGRNDFQIKLRGFRIELGEIEAQLRANPAVREAVVIVREDRPGDKRLVAYVRARDGLVFDPAAARERLTAVLPDYMIPGAFVVVDAYPLTANGKLDRHALPAPDARAAVTRAYMPPQGQREGSVAEIWQSLLGIERAGRLDNFFELGGHSLLAVQLVSRLRQSLGVEIPLREVFARPTLADLAAAIERAAAVPASTIPRVDRTRPLAVSWSQQRLWFLDQLDPAASRAYHIPAGIQLRGSLDRAVLRKALDRVVARHESLRTSFQRAADGRPLQRIAPANQGFHLIEHDLRERPPHEHHAVVHALTAKEARDPFDLAAGPLIRGRLLRLADDEHVLLVTQHHIISDGWSNGVLVRELAAIYGAFSQGHPDPLPGPAIQYADYAAWQRDWLSGPAVQAQVEFWRTQLQGAPALLELPADHPRPPVASYRGASVPVRIAPPLAAKLRAFSHRHGATLFMTLLAGWSSLLSRLSGQAEVVTGTPVANRSRTEIESVIGCFVNTLALRVRVADDPTVAELLARVRETTLAAYAHQDLPFEQVVEALQPERNLGHNPVFQTMLALDNTPAQPVRLPGLELIVRDVPHTTAQCDLMFSLAEHGDGIEGRLDYATDLFTAATIERMSEQFQTVLEGMVDDDARRVSRLPLLSAAQRYGVVVAFNDTAQDYPTDKLLHQLLEDQARRQPSAIAVVCEAQRVSYDALNRRANQLAHSLIGLGVRPDDRVALCAERSVDLVVGILGTLKAGACYVPLDPAYPAERLAHMLRDSAPVALLTQRALRDLVPPHDLPTLALDTAEVRNLLAGSPESDPDPAALGLDAHHLAYVMYTSGSTGLPKGVMVPHGAVVNRILWGQQEYPLTAADRVIQKTPFSFDPSLFELFWTFVAGARLVMARPDAHQDIDYLVEAIEDHELTMIHFVSSMLSLFIDVAKRRPLPSLRRVVIGGEALPYAVQQRFHDQLPGVELLNLYGPTETAIEVTHWLCVPDRYPGIVPIGYPIANTQIYIVDDHRQPLPIGVAGEIYIGGAQVSRGYLNQPELTAERFLSDDFVEQPDRRLYRTGDLGRWLPDGAIEFLGRRDAQVKIRGLRLELGEIEARLAACAGVREAVVVARLDRHGDKRLVGYYVPAEGAAPSAAALRTELAQFLTEPMIPGAFVQLPALPLTPNGKLDRRLLPEPDQSAVATRTYVAPDGEIETAVAAVWQELLGLDRVGRDDNFFALGGHSLLAVQVVSRLRQVLGAEVALRDLFTHATVAAFAEAVSRAPSTALSPIPRAERGGPLPLSWAQQRLWFLDQLDHAVSAAYHMSEGLRLRGRLDRDALQATFDRIVARHEVLRTTFASAEGVAVQVIASPDVGFHILDEDLRSLDDAERTATVRRRCSAEATEPFDLSRGPLLRARLLRLADDDHLLLITKHHIISDGWSVGLFIQEVVALYSAFTLGQPDPLPPPALQYADYAIWQQQWLRGEVLDRQVRFWTDYLAGAPPVMQLPTDRPRPEIQRHVGRRLPFALPPETARGLHALSRKHGTTPFMALLSGWSALLSRLCGQTDVVVGTPVANRQRAEVESIIGFFANVLALRVDLDGDPTVAELLARTKASATAAYAHQDLPFEQVVDALQPPRSLSHNPLFQVSLTLENVPTEQALVLPHLAVEIVELPHSTTQFDLALHLIERGSTFEGRFYYSSDLFDDDTIVRLGEQLGLVLRAMVDDDQQHVSRLPLLTGAQRHRVVTSFNDTHRAVPRDALLHPLFEDQVRRQPDAIAVVDEERSITYRELNDRANVLAHHLIDLGVRADDLVAILLARSANLLVAVLGILKAGAGYLPLDPSYPAERLVQIAGDGAPKAVVTERLARDAWPIAEIPVVLVDALDGAGRQLDNPDPAALGLTARNLAYVLYTSGSTGAPKGVMIEHRNVVHLWAALDRTAFADATPGARVGLNAAMTFDASVQAMVQLLSGRTVVIVPHAARLDAAAFIDYLRAHRVEAFDCTPSQLRFLLDAGLLERADHVPSTVLVGGEAISVELWRRMKAAPATRFYNVYGPTECTVDATLADLRELGDRPSIGRPLSNTQVYVLDAQRQPVPIGVTGEIYIGGAGVARGYLHRSELTAERFVENCFGAEPGQRMYRTGDLARWLPDGTIEYLGRNDFQIKLRGYRIELGEIESHLRASALVHDAVVVAREDRPGDKRLVAYVVPRDGVTIDAATLRTHLVARLPDYMVPAAFVALDRLPTTSSGKLDHAALPAPDATAVAAREYAAPVGDTESAIAAIWQSLLELERVGRHDDFFELGGYSLTAIQVVARIREQFGVSLPLTRLFQATTIADLAEAVLEAQLAGYAPADIEQVSSEIDELGEAELMALLNPAD